jgi:hypothetical protein
MAPACHASSARAAASAFPRRPLFRPI